MDRRTERHSELKARINEIRLFIDKLQERALIISHSKIVKALIEREGTETPKVGNCFFCEYPN